MPHGSRFITVMKPTTIAADTSVILNVPDGATAFHGYCTSGAATGTSPTLNVEIYHLVPTAVAADTNGLDSTDHAYANMTAIGYGQLTQFTGAATLIFAAVGSGNYEETAALPTAGSFRNGPIESIWKVTFNVGGTNPSFAGVSMVVAFNP